MANLHDITPPTAGPAAIARNLLPTEIRPLTALRGVAALWVVMLHLSETCFVQGYTTWVNMNWNDFVCGGRYCVDIFFILSGFIITHSYDGRKARFVLGRVARLFPLNAAVLSAMVLFALACGYFGHPAGLDYALLPGDYLLVSAALGLPTGWNFPTWSVSTELVAYGLFLLTQGILRRASRALIVFGLLLAILLEMHLIAGPMVPRTCAGFSAGMMLRLCDFPPVKDALADLAALALLTAFWFAEPALAVLPILVLLQGLSKPGASRSHRALLHVLPWRLGQVSYSVYLIHIPLILVATSLINASGWKNGSHIAVVFTLSTLAAVISIAPLTYRFIELPAQRWVRSAGDAAIARYRSAMLDRTAPEIGHHLG